MSDNRPISEQFRIVALQFADAEAAATLLENAKDVTLQQRIAALDDSLAYNKREMMVKSSQAWADYINEMTEARNKARKLKLQLEHIRMKFTEWNSAEANKRAEMKL